MKLENLNLAVVLALAAGISGIHDCNSFTLEEVRVENTQQSHRLSGISVAVAVLFNTLKIYEQGLLTSPVEKRHLLYLSLGVGVLLIAGLLSILVFSYVTGGSNSSQLNVNENLTFNTSQLIKKFDVALLDRKNQVISSLCSDETYLPLFTKFSNDFASFSETIPIAIANRNTLLLNLYGRVYTGCSRRYRAYKKVLDLLKLEHPPVKTRTGTEFKLLEEGKSSTIPNLDAVDSKLETIWEEVATPPSLLDCADQSLEDLLQGRLADNTQEILDFIWSGKTHFDPLIDPAVAQKLHTSAVASTEGRKVVLDNVGVFLSKIDFVITEFTSHTDLVSAQIISFFSKFF